MSSEPDLLNSLTQVPVVLLLDCSWSMSEDNRIGALNDGLKIFKDELMKDEQARKRADISIITFGGDAKLHTDYSNADNFTPPTLTADGGTPMGEAIQMGLDKIEERKRYYNQTGIPYYRPWIFMITDGAPTDDIVSATTDVPSAVSNKKCLFYAVGVGDDADFDTLRQICHPEIPPLKLAGINFQELFKWLSASVNAVVNSDSDTGMVALPPVDGWAVAGL